MSTPPVIQLENVTLTDWPGVPLNWELRAGEALLVRTPAGAALPMLADVVQGLSAPSAGRALVAGTEWRSLSPDAAAALRGRMGRVFHDHAWISNLDVDENITLRLRHHTTQPESQILAEAAALARTLGLPEIPPGRPAWVNTVVLQQCQWVRALLGAPAVVVLENPEQYFNPEQLSACLAALQSARAGGAAVLWFTSREQVWHNPPIDTDHRVRWVVE